MEEEAKIVAKSIKDEICEIFNRGHTRVGVSVNDIKGHIEISEHQLLDMVINTQGGLVVIYDTNNDRRILVHPRTAFGIRHLIFGPDGYV